MLAHLDGSFLQACHAMTVPHGAKQSRTHKGLDLEVVVFRVVDDAPVESFARPFQWSSEQTSGAVAEPVDADSSNSFILGPAMEEARKCLTASHLQKFVGVEESHPRVPVTKHLYTCGVVFFLDAFSVA